MEVFMSTLVKYNNSLNDVALRGLTPTEINIFLAICAKAKNNPDIISITFEELKKITGYSQNNSRFVAEVLAVNKKLLACSISVANGSKIHQFTLFDEFVTDTDLQLLTVSLHSRFKYMLTNLIGNFTQFELQEFIGVKSIYAKRAYMLAKQFRSTGVFKMPIDKFREILCVPECYSMSNFNSTVLRPIVAELSTVFKDFKVIKVKTNRTVKMLEFYFKPEKKATTILENANFDFI
jgi:plasmid replication initiation protein